VTVASEIESQGTSRAEESQWALSPLAWKPVLGLAGARLAMLLAVATRYGWHRDELYYVMGGRHLSLGYVDHALLTPWVARGVEGIFGTSLFALRTVPALLGCGLVIMTALIARELGGDRRAQILAALCFALDPFFLGANHLFQTVTFDQVAWVLASFALVRLLRTGDERWWIAVGGAVGLGMLAKPTILIWVISVTVGVLCTRERSVLRSKLLAPAVALVAVGSVAFLVFQIQHGWAFVEFSRHMDAQHAGENRSQFVLAQFVVHNPISAFVWIPGLVALLRRPSMARWKAFGIAFLVGAVLLLVVGGKYYYLAPLFPVLYAAGAVQLARKAPHISRGLLVGLVLGSLLTLPASLPVLSASAINGTPYAGLNRDAFEEVGWPEFITTVERAVPAGSRPAVIVTNNYGEAAALQVLGDGRTPVVGRQNSEWLWGPGPVGPDTVLVTVGFDLGELSHVGIVGCRTVATIDNPGHIDNNERGADVRICRANHAWPEVWRELRAYD
jgi:hypothetical protein